MLGPGGVEGETLRLIAEGTLLLVMDVTSNGIVDDETVSVHLFVAAPPGPACDNRTLVCPAGATCPSAATVAMPGLCGPQTGGPVAPATIGRIVEGQPFRELTDLGTVDATITDGRLELDAPMIPLTLVVDSTPILLPLRQAHIAGDLSPDGSALTNGEIGARVLASEFGDLELLAACPGLCIDEPTFRSVAHPDLEMDVSGVCQALSAGLSFEAVHAE